jgi:hypothetical protein
VGGDDGSLTGIRDGPKKTVLRAVLNAGQTIDALGHVDRIGLSAFDCENGLRAKVRTGSVTVTLAIVYGYHVHASCSSLLKCSASSSQRTIHRRGHSPLLGSLLG